MGMGVDEMASSLHAGFFPVLEIFWVTQPGITQEAFEGTMYLLESLVMSVQILS